MVPTLLGAHRLAECQRCDLRWRVPADAGGSSSSDLTCAHCGDVMDVAEQDATGRNTGGVAADTLEATALDPNHPPARGDLVAVSWEGQFHVKRIAALAGDTVSLDGLKLLVNGRRVEDLLQDHPPLVPLPTFLVDNDARRDESRWSAPRQDSLWIRTPVGTWRYEGAGDSPWLIYHHRSIHGAKLSSPVRDDYPFNVGLRRKLEPVDRLFLSGQVELGAAHTVEVAFFSERGNVVAAMRLPDTAQDVPHPIQLSYYDGVDAPSAPVTANQPLAVRVRGGPAELSKLSIERLVQYRIRRRDPVDYPIEVGTGDYYLLGDNVPVSVDSRQLGNFTESQIVGKVIGVAREKRSRDTW